MTWTEVRQQYVSQWLLIEAIKAHSEHEHRYLDDIAVVGVFSDSATAFQEYQFLHQTMPQRELYVCHTDRETLDITERAWLGVRAAVFQTPSQPPPS